MNENKKFEEEKLKKEEDGEYQMVKPNGGFGWCVALGAFLGNIFTLSLTSIYGLLFGPFLESLGQSTVGIALVLNSCSVIINLTGLITGFVFKNFTPRAVTITGSLLICSGLLISAFSKSYWMIILGYSVFVGLGQGLLIPAAFLAINSYFTTKKFQAVGISLAGASLGQMMMPVLVSHLLDRIGFRGTVLIIAALSLHGVVGGLLFQPVENHLRKVKVEDVEESDKKKEFLQRAVITKESTIWEKFKHVMDLKLLRFPTFLNIIFGLGFFYTVNINFSMLLPFYLKETVELDTKNTAYCMTALAGADFISRLTFPMITSRYKLSSRTVFLIGIFAMVLGRTILAEMDEFFVLIGICIFYGYFRALGVVSQNLSISEYCHEKCPECLPGALGLFMLTKVFCVITFGQFLGWIRDYFNSYSLCLHVQDIFFVAVLISWLSEFLYKKLKNKE